MKAAFVFFILSLTGIYSNASVFIDGTRAIYKGDDKEITVKLTNPGKLPVLVQSWIDKGNVRSDPASIDVPFFLTPPIARINGGKSQTLRIGHTGSDMPSDRETIFWLNVLEIPQSKVADSGNKLQIAYRTRIKLFYRPVFLDGTSGVAAESLSWRVDENSLVAENNSPFFVSLVGVKYKSPDGEVTISADIIYPFGYQYFPMENLRKINSKTIVFSYVNDWGAFKTASFILE